MSDVGTLDEWAAPMDEEIAPLVVALNRQRGIRTLESCAGHPEREHYEYPWVRFHAPTATRRLTRWVDRAETRRQQHEYAMFATDRLISLVYEGAGVWKVQGQYVTPQENQRIVEALLEAL